MMAHAFAAYREVDNVVIFASGVSNSLETDPAAFEREQTLLRRIRASNPESLLVYFGTFSVDDPDRIDTPYVWHKLEMESLIARSSGRWLVLRLGLAIGPKKSGSTLHEFIYQRIAHGEHFEVWANAVRYPIDVEDVARIGSRLIGDPSMHDRRINVALRAFPITAFVRIIEDIMGRKADFTLVDKGRPYNVGCPEVGRLVAELGLDTSEGYLERVLRKYLQG